jgi:hypothetical protein
VRLLVIASIIAPSILAAQSGERISLSRAPAPNQTIQFRIVQDTDVDFTMANMPGGAGTAGESAKLGGKTQIEMTMRVGAPDAQGRMSAEVAYDSITANVTVNGVPLSTNSAVAPLQGQTMTATYDAQGALVDVKAPDSLAASGVDLKELLMTLMGRMPTTSLAVGETATIPLDVPFPLPMSGGQSTHLTGQAVYKLISIARDGDARIAHLDYTTDAKMASEMPIGDRGSLTMDVRMTGGGTCQWNVDRRYMKGSDQKMTFEGSVSGGPDMTIHGTMRVQMEGSRRP